jgi:hypothetical protein
MSNLNITGTITPSRQQAGVDWAAVAADLGPRVKVAWVRAEYAMLRGDKGQGPVARGVTIPGVGTAWVTVCHHGTGHRASTGGAAENNGRDRALWCEHCAADRPATLPLLGAAPTTTAAQEGPAQPEQEPQPESTTTAEQEPQPEQERKPMSAAQRRAIAAAQR